MAVSIFSRRDDIRQTWPRRAGRETVTHRPPGVSLKATSDVAAQDRFRNGRIVHGTERGDRAGREGLRRGNERACSRSCGCGGMRKGKGWYATFAFLIVISFAAIYALTGMDALGAAARFLWNGLVFIGNGIVRVVGGLLQMLARGVGWRRLSRIGSMVTGVGLGYAASVVLSDSTVSKARGWRGKLQAALKIARAWWQDLPLWAKLAVVAALIASQVYLHVALIVFPIAFLVPVVRRLWVGTADLLFGKWYWRTFGNLHRATVSTLRTLPGVRRVMEGFRLVRLRYLYAWRLWRYDPRYRDASTGGRRVSLIEPLRLWWHGELDGYVGRPLLAGTRQAVAPGD